jgi:hypothetical protein
MGSMRGARLAGIRAATSAQTAERPGIGGLHSIDLVFQQARSHYRGGSANSHGASDLPQCTPQDHPGDPLARGSQGRADADLAGALGHNVCRNAIRPQAGERQCQQAEDPSELRDEPLARRISLQLLAQKKHPQHAEIRIDFVEGTAHLRLQVAGSWIGAEFNILHEVRTR